MRLVWLVVTAAAGLAGCGQPAGPGAVVGGYTEARHAALTEGAGAYEAGLDAALAARDYAGIVHTLEAAWSGDDAALRGRSLNWLALKQESGPTDTVFIGSLYAVGLVVQAAHSQGAERAGWWKIAASAYFRTVFVALSEAGQCADPVAADGRFGIATHTMEPARALVMRMGQAEKEAAARDAVVLVALTYRSRYPDAWLCLGRDGRAVFRPYAAWEASRLPALQAAEKGVFVTTPAPPVAGFVSVKNAEIVGLYGG